MLSVVGKCCRLNMSGEMPSVVSAGYVTYMTYRAHEMMVDAGRFVDGLRAAGVEFFVAVPVISPCGYHCTDFTMVVCPLVYIV